MILNKLSNMTFHNKQFSPPDMSESETKEVRDTILSGWITIGPRTKKLEKTIAMFNTKNENKKRFVRIIISADSFHSLGTWGFGISNYPNAYHLFENETTLSLNTRMIDEDVDTLSNILWKL